MKKYEAIEECSRWLASLDRQREKTIKMQRLASQARKGPEEARAAQKELRQMDRQPRIYDAAKLETAVKILIGRKP